MTTSELLTERANQLRTMVNEITDSANNDNIKQISLSYVTKLITIKPLTNDIAKLYVPVLQLLADTIAHEASIMEAEADKAAAQEAQQLGNVTPSNQQQLN